MSLAIPERNAAPAKTPKPATRAEQQTMRDLVERATASDDPQAFADCLRKRAWLRRGMSVAHLAEEEIPQADRPFSEFYEAVHGELLRRLLAQTKAQSGSAAWTAYHTLLERLNRDEYGRNEPGAGSGVTVVIVERPHRADT